MNAPALATKIDVCEKVLVQHRFSAPSSPGDWGTLTTTFLYECDKHDCGGSPEEHTLLLPCRWSWPLAHGKGFNGQPFPRRRCPGCEHIRRAGQPHVETVAM